MLTDDRADERKAAEASSSWQKNKGLTAVESNPFLVNGGLSSRCPAGFVRLATGCLAASGFHRALATLADIVYYVFAALAEIVHDAFATLASVIHHLLAT